MPSKIRVLTEQTINQIAAGEVIENPSSVVKELVENSIDAGATEITVEIRAGGRQLIRISDNGCGMSKDDAVLCLERHATSKIRHLDDLNELITMGFRGEALPSIASIAKVNILTRATDEQDGTMVMVDGGKILSCGSAARSPGTTIEVKSLFFNVPVRKKFQKSPAYDVQEIQKVVTLIALANPHLSIELISNQENVLKTLGSKSQESQSLLKERIKDVLGPHFSEDSLPINVDSPPYKITGFLGSPYYHRPNRTGQYVFINHRPVASSLISFAVKEGYGMVLPPNRYPVFVLYIDLPGEDVDVNVHPQKKEVRFSKEQQLKEWISRSVENALSLSTSPMIQMSENEFEMPVYEMKSPSIIQESTSFSSQSEQRVTAVQLTLENAVPPSSYQPSVKVLAVIQGYVLVEPTALPQQISKGGLCLVDPRGAQARINFERLMVSHSSPETQTLLVPYTLDLPPSEASLLRERTSDLQSMGFQLREFGPTTFIVEGLPNFLQEANVLNLIKEFISQIQEHRTSKGLQHDLRKRLALASCNAIRHSFEKINLNTAQGIIDQLMRCENPYQSPLGKPIMVHISPEELEGKFQK